MKMALQIGGTTVVDNSRNVVNVPSVTNAGTLALSATGANTITASTNGTERVRIDSAGNLLVGRTSSGVGSATTGVVILPSGIMELANADTTNNTVGYRQYSTSAGANRFFVGYAGTIFATSTSITAISDQSLKENIRELDTGLAEVMALKPRRFDWKPETQLSETNVPGFIAQEVAAVLPELVYDYQYNQDTIKKGLKMGDMLPTLVKAIQEQQAIINDLKARLDAANL
jgi:hypothetical protein